LILLVIGSVYLVWPHRGGDDFFADTVTHYQRAHQDLEKFSRTAGTDPTARVLDLKPWGYHLLGRSIQQASGRESRVFVYHGQHDDLLVAQEVEGENFSPPRGATVVRKSGKDFVTFSNGDVNLVAWQDKNIVCVLASKLPKDRVVALAGEIAERA
jgi:anti-sigma factor RsiW